VTAAEASPRGMLRSEAIFSGAIHEFRSSETRECELGAILDRLSRSQGQQGVGSTLKVTAYLRDVHACARVRGMASRMGIIAPALELAAQPPASGAEVALLEWRIRGAGVARVQGAPASCISQPGVDWCYAAVESSRRDGEPVGDQFAQAFASVGDRLARCGGSVGDIVRTWIYIGEINGAHEGSTVYQAINQARRVAFRHLDWGGGPRRLVKYPASTGIGTAAGFLSLGALACLPAGEVRLASLENPRQTSAFEYPRDESDIPPLFSRAIALGAGGEVMVLISGTASIVRHRSVHAGSARQQVDQAFANIAELLRPEFLAANGFPVKAGGLAALRCCVVYGKRPEDVNAVRSACERWLPPGIPAVYTLSDVCRPELLVEIEGIAIMSSTPSGAPGETP
jgi:chorismate lyase/3-hydroxybenzoate synthase